LLRRPTGRLARLAHHFVTLHCDGRRRPLRLLVLDRASPDAHDALLSWRLMDSSVSVRCRRGASVGPQAIVTSTTSGGRIGPDPVADLGHVREVLATVRVLTIEDRSALGDQVLATLAEV